MDTVEATLLQALLDELDTVLAGDDPDDDVLRRLYPAGYRDNLDAEIEFRALTESGLRSDRSERIDACRAELAAAQRNRGGVEVDLADPDTGRRWLQVLNDLRLTLGTRLGVTEGDDLDFDPHDPDEQPRVVYHWLTAVQDTLVQALMR